MSEHAECTGLKKNWIELAAALKVTTRSLERWRHQYPDWPRPINGEHDEEKWRDLMRNNALGPYSSRANYTDPPKAAAAATPCAPAQIAICAPITSVKEIRKALESWILYKLECPKAVLTHSLVSERYNAAPAGSYFLSHQEALTTLEALSFSYYRQTKRAVPGAADVLEWLKTHAWLNGLGLPNPRTLLSPDESAVLSWYRRARAAAADDLQGGEGQVQILRVGDSRFVASANHRLRYVDGLETIVDAAHVSEGPFGDEEIEAARDPSSKLCVMSGHLKFKP